MLEMMRCMLLRMLDVLDVPEVMRSVLLCLTEVVEVSEAMRCTALLDGRDEGDAMCATLLDGGAGGAGGDALCATLCAGRTGDAERAGCA